MIIYKVTNNINGKIYIGKRISDSSSYLGSGKLIKRAIKKYGAENFHKEIIDSAETIEELNEKEIFWINEYKSNNLKIGYNISSGGDGGDTISNNPDIDLIIEKQKRTKKEMGIGLGKKNPRFGRKNLEEHNKKISEKMKEMYEKGEIQRFRMSAEGKKILSERMKNNNPNSTPLGRIKNSERNTGDKNPNAYLYIFTSPDGKEIIVIGGIKEFCKKNEISYKAINKLNKGIIPEYKGWRCKKIGKIKNL